MKIYAAMILFFVSVSTAAAEKNIDINVGVEGNGCDMYLNIQFVNRFDDVITLKPDALPWAESSNGMYMFLYGWNGGEIFGGASLIVNSMSEKKLNLLPGGTLTGRIRLKEKIPNFMKLMSERDMTLTWQYIFYERERAVHIIKVGAVHLQQCDPTQI